MTIQSFVFGAMFALCVALIGWQLRNTIGHVVLHTMKFIVATFDISRGILSWLSEEWITTPQFLMAIAVFATVIIGGGIPAGVLVSRMLQ